MRQTTSHHNTLTPNQHPTNPIDSSPGESNQVNPPTTHSTHPCGGARRGYHSGGLRSGGHPSAGFPVFSDSSLRRRSQRLGHHHLQQPGRQVSTRPTPQRPALPGRHCPAHSLRCGSVSGGGSACGVAESSASCGELAARVAESLTQRGESACWLSHQADVASQCWHKEKMAESAGLRRCVSRGGGWT